MITCEKNISNFNGSPKELCLELAYIVGGLKECFIKEFNLTEDDVNMALAESIKLGLMSNWERKEYLDSLEDDYLIEREFDKM